ncbi:CLUMA_CG011071, isoform A [Clunio marinus]|uniref:CLUMA_CG011071, isoform A n=1 Tax=Clunio marinus TaxID=568069 RepID=A0A1J1IBW3_9DIPT|nr:CLUMA_CG011071, isoform A [Clunio marinus]
MKQSQLTLWGIGRAMSYSNLDASVEPCALHTALAFRVLRDRQGVAPMVSIEVNGKTEFDKFTKFL